MKRKPRVLIDTFHLVQALTGIRTYTTQLCEGIEKARFTDVDYLIYPNWQWLNKTQLLRGKVNVVKKLANHLLFFLWKQICLPLLILFKRVDLVVAPDYLLPRFKFGARSIAVFHDTFYWELKGQYNPVWRWYFLKSVHAGLNKKTELIVTSKYIGEKVRNHITDKYKPSVVYQTPKELGSEDCDRFDFQKIGLPQGARYFLHVGIFEERKNLGVLVRAFSELIKNDYFEGFYLILAGSRAAGWFQDDFNNLNELIKKHGLVERVLMPGFILNQDLSCVYRSAFAYVFPSKEEGFGIPVLEAMKSNLPVIISDQPALVEVAGDAALIFERDSVEELSDRMNQLSDADTRQKLITKGKRRVEAFTQEAFAQQFHQKVKQCLDSL